MKTKILISTSSFAVYDEGPLTRLHAAGFETVLNPHKRKLTRDEVVELLPGISGLIAGVERLDAGVLKDSGLKVISRVGAGLSNIDLAVADELGIKVCSTPDAPTNAVAELTVAGMLNCLRQIPRMDRDLHQGEWHRQNGYQLEGKTVLIVGYGRIGRRVAQLLNPFGVKLLVSDPYLSADVDARHRSLDEALPEADIITFHCSGETCLLTAERFETLKPGVIICNASRGSLVDEAALVKSLREKTTRACWLDTFVEEPYSGELTEFPNAVLTPHVGAFTRECRVKMEMQAVENLIRALERVTA